MLVLIRRRLYLSQIIKPTSFPVPIIIVGNITVGGNGKTPVVIAIQFWLKQLGYQVGIVNRGYKSGAENELLILNAANTSPLAGDEANMLSELCTCPIGIGADRVAVTEHLLSQYPDVDCILADDGLQHYQLERDIEIAIKRERAMGNGFCLPAGPLRERRSRLQQVDLVIDRDSEDVKENFGLLWQLEQPEQTCTLTSFSGQTVHALAGIGLPELFFQALETEGLKVVPHAYEDHHPFELQDIPTEPDYPILVTHKDAVKLRQFRNKNIWVVPLELQLSDDVQYQLKNLLQKVRKARHG